MTASLAQCTVVASKKENVILQKNNSSITRPPSGRAPLTPLPRNARDFRPVFCPYFCYWPATAQHPGFQPLSPPSNLHSPPVQIVPRRTSRGGSAGGGLVRLFLPRHPKAAVVLFIQSTYKNRMSCGVAPFCFKSTREDSIAVVSVMACHLPAWPPVGTTGASLMTSSSTVAGGFSPSPTLTQPLPASQSWASAPALPASAG